MALHSIPLVCPLDGLPLAPCKQSLTCARRHSFDISSSGYANLLLAHFKASRDPGDSKPMVSARRRVLEAGYFDPLAEAVCAAAIHESDRAGDEHNNGNMLLVDAGCGEGFYTARLARALRARTTQTDSTQADWNALGIDISKWAVLAASKRYKDIGWAVASNKRLPVPQGAARLITSLFGFEMWAEWALLQNPGQSVITVSAGSRHLIELREIIYPSLRVHDAPIPEAASSNGYALTVQTNVRYEQTAARPETLMDILEMTPHGHKSSAIARNGVQALEKLPLTFDAVVRVYQRR